MQINSGLFGVILGYALSITCWLAMSHSNYKVKCAEFDTYKESHVMTNDGIYC